MQFQIFMLIAILKIVSALPFVLPPPEDVTVDMINNLPPGTLTPELVSQLPPGYVEKLSPEVMAVIPQDLKQQNGIITPSVQSTLPEQENINSIIGSSKDGGYYTNLKDASILLPPNSSPKEKVDTTTKINKTPEYSGSNKLVQTPIFLTFLVSIFYFI